MRYKIAIQASIQMLFKNGLSRGRGGKKSAEPASCKAALRKSTSKSASLVLSHAGAGKSSQSLPEHVPNRNAGSLLALGVTATTVPSGEPEIP